MASAGTLMLTTVKAKDGPDGQKQALTDCGFVNSKDLETLAAGAGIQLDSAKKKGILAAVGEVVLYLKVDDTIPAGSILANGYHRLAGRLEMGKPVPVSPFFPPRDGYFALATIQIELSTVGSLTGQVTIDAQELVTFIKQDFVNHPYRVNQCIGYDYHAGMPDRALLKLAVKGFEFLDLKTGQKAAAPPADGRVLFGQITRETEVLLSRLPAAAHIKITGSSAGGRANKLFERGFNFEELGIGGLDAQFQDIFRRAFASRLVPPEILKRMGQNHVRGMLLFGPPGCGKTLIARKIGKALHAKQPKIVNGPEILNKYVGQSEENIRELFKDAEAEQAEKGDDSELHIIIFDEFDAIAKQRGTVSNGTGTNDSIVNQLLSKIDGVEALNNILIIGMTNRKEMIDEAVLRPGRLELHVEIGLPDENGRAQILNIHTSELRKSGMLAADVSIRELAERTKNYTGAELEGLVKAACSYVFSRQVDITNPEKAVTFDGVQVGREDFERALAETQPAFGVKEDELTQCFAGGMVRHGPDFDRVYTTMMRLVNQVKNSDRTPLVSVLLTGPSGSGKTALAAKIAVESGFPFVKRISGVNLLGHHDEGKTGVVAKVFNDAYRSPLSLIILDDIERVINYVRVGHIFSNAVLQTLLVLVKALPPPGHKLMIIGTSAIPDLLEAMEITASFQLQVGVPLLESRESFEALLSSSGVLAPGDVSAVASHLEGKPVGVKKLLNVLEMARQDDEGRMRPGPVTETAFMEAAIEWGL